MKLSGLLVVFIISFGFAPMTMATNDPLSAGHAIWRTINGHSENASSADIEKLLDQYFDVQKFSELALAEHWPNWSEKQRVDFEREFLASLAKRIRRSWNDRGKINKPVMRLKNRDAEYSEASLKALCNGKTITMDIYMIKRPAGWRVYDYDFEGVNLVRNYMAQFNKLLRLYGYAGFIERIRTYPVVAKQ